MRKCGRCGRDFPEVRGADEQTCPHCGAVTLTPQRAAQAPRVGRVADPVSALSLAFRIWVKHPFALLLLWIPAVLVNVAASLTLAAYAQANGFPTDPFAMTDAQRLEYLGVALPGAVAVFVIELALWGVVSAFVASTEGDANALKKVGSRVLPLVIGGLLLTVALGAGLVLLVVPFFVFLHWFMFVPAALAEGKSVPEAFAASRQFARERMTFGFTALVVLVWVGIFVIDSVISALFGGVFGAFGAEGGYANAISGALGMWALAPFLPLLPAAYWALAKQAPVEGVAAPIAPDARPSERFRTTKCPQCGTLVPYSATGQPVDVVCPVCGRAGKVV